MVLVPVLNTRVIGSKATFFTKSSASVVLHALLVVCYTESCPFMLCSDAENSQSGYPDNSTAVSSSDYTLYDSTYDSTYYTDPSSYGYSGDQQAYNNYYNSYHNGADQSGSYSQYYNYTQPATAPHRFVYCHSALKWKLHSYI